MCLSHLLPTLLHLTVLRASHMCGMVLAPDLSIGFVLEMDAKTVRRLRLKSTAAPHPLALAALDRDQWVRVFPRADRKWWRFHLLKF